MHGYLRIKNMTGREGIVPPRPPKNAKKLGFFDGFRVALAKPVDTSCAVHQLLLSGVKRMAVVADFNMGAFDR